MYQQSSAGPQLSVPVGGSKQILCQACHADFIVPYKLVFSVMGMQKIKQSSIRLFPTHCRQGNLPHIRLRVFLRFKVQSPSSEMHFLSRNFILRSSSAMVSHALLWSVNFRSALSCVFKRSRAVARRCRSLQHASICYRICVDTRGRRLSPWTCIRLSPSRALRMNLASLQQPRPRQLSPKPKTCRQTACVNSLGVSRVLWVQRAFRGHRL